MRLLLKKKTDEVKDLISDQMTYQISEANDAMYAGEEDKAVSVYENILNGDYEEMKYARKSMHGQQRAEIFGLMIEQISF